MAINYDISNESMAQINEFFTSNYDFKQWFFKIKTYDIILDNPERFVVEYGDEELKKENIVAYKLALKSEVVFTFFHMAEALFSLMYCCRKSPVPWVDMKSIRFDTLCAYVKNEVVTGQICDEDIRFLFYNGVIGEEAKKEIVVNSINFIKDFLKRMGKLFLKYGDIYNEYKHGLRLVSTQAQIQITPKNVPNLKPVVSLSGDAHIFLTTTLLNKDGKEEIHKIRQTTVSFDYKLYLRLCIYIFRLINNIFSVRRQATTLTPGEQMKITPFNPKDLVDLFKEDPKNKFSFTIDYPGCKDTTKSLEIDLL